jgi:hypothetical protein
MFARIFRMALKPGQGDGYAHAIDEKVIPILRKFAGFRDEIAMVSIWMGRKRLASASGNGRKTQKLTTAEGTRMSTMRSRRSWPARLKSAPTM